MSSKNWLICLVLFHAGFGCGTSDEAKTDAGDIAGDAATEVAADAAAGDGHQCPFGCPAANIGVSLAVTAAMDGGAVSGVEATLSGPTTETLSCMPSPSGAVTICTWASGPVIAGSYSLQVTAPAFQPVNVSAVVSVTSDCGCMFAALVPSMVTLDPSATDASAAGDSSVSTRNAVPVSVSNLFGAAVAPCPSGFEHANICCQGAPYKATVCDEDLTHPFAVCETGQYAYPDPNACCSLDDRTACVQPSIDGSTADAGQAGSCQNPCAPGAYPPSDISMAPGGASVDGFLCCFGTGLSCQSRQPFCSLCTGPVDWCSTQCPAGWTAPAGGQVDSCCQTDSSGQNFCFSQAGYIGDLGGGGVRYANASSCLAEQFADDGNSYVMKCDSTASPACSCLVNGVVTHTVPDSSQCADLTACEFPQ